MGGPCNLETAQMEVVVSGPSGPGWSLGVLKGVAATLSTYLGGTVNSVAIGSVSKLPHVTMIICCFTFHFSSGSVGVKYCCT